MTGVGKLACGIAAAAVSVMVHAETYTWTGGSGNWEEGAHWVSSQSTTGTAPGTGDKAVLPGVAGGYIVTVNAAFEIGSMEVGDNSGAAVTLCFNHADINEVAGNVHVYSGATLTHTANGATETYKLNLASGGDFTIDIGAKVDAYRRGYGVGKGPGGGSGSTQQGGHASLGYNAASGAVVYGSVRAPIECGSGGGKVAENKGAGGGAIHLDVAGTLTVNGSVSANSGANDWGAGAGGSVWLKAGTIRGAGSVSACCEEKGSGREGGGGRISLVQTVATDWTAFTGAVSAGPSSTSGPGTIYRETAADRPGEGELTIPGVSGNSMKVLLTPDVEDACEPFGKVTVKQYGYLQINGGVTLRVVDALTAGGSSFATSGDGAVELMPAAGETLDVSGTLSARHLIATNAGSTVSFAKNATVTSSADGSLTLGGTSAAPLTLTGTNGAWKLIVAANVDERVSYVNVSNCNSSAGAVVADVRGANLGGTTNWTFPQQIAQPGDLLTWTGASGNTGWRSAGNWRDANGDPRSPTSADVIVIPAGCAKYPEITLDFAGNAITNASDASLTLKGADLTLTGDFICAGAFACTGSETWTVAGTVDFTGATVTPGTSLGVLDAAGAQRVTTAGKTFYDLKFLSPTLTLIGGFTAREVTCDQNAAVSLTFGTSGVFKADKYRMIVGTGSISLASETEGEYWHLAAGVGSVFENVSVSDSDATPGDPVSTVSYTDLGHNLNWRKGASVWTGAADAVWTNAANWTGSVPGADSDVFVQGGTSQPTISEETTVRSLLLGGGASSATLTVRGNLTVCEGLAVGANGTLVADAPIVVSNGVNLSAGAKMTHTAGSYNSKTGTDTVYRLDVSALGDFTINPGASIDTFLCGYAKGRGPSGGYTVYSTSQGVHASKGKNPVGAIYGNVRAPVLCGAGGGKAGSNGNGGGAVRLDVAGTLTVDGKVNADSGANDWGSGAGGSVWLKAGTIRGSGSVSACCVKKGSGEKAGGGRISLVQTNATDWSAFTATVSVGPSNDSGPGTIYRETAADEPGRGELVINGQSGNAYVVELTPDVEDANEPFGKVTVNSYGRLQVNSDVTLRVTEAVSAGGSEFKTSGSGAVELMPAAGETLNVSGGTLTIDHLVATNAGGTVSVAKGVVISVPAADGSLLLAGTEENPLTLIGPSGKWQLNVGANTPQDVSYVSVSNCNSNGGAAITDFCGTNLGGTDNWMFTKPVETGARLTWTGAAGTTSWIEGGNWEDDKGESRPPAATDVFVIPAGCEVYPVIVDNFTGNTISNQANASLTLGNNCKLTLTGDFICAGAFTCRGSETWTVEGTVDFTGATVTPGTSTGVLGTTGQVQRVTTAAKTFYDLVLATPEMTLVGGFTARRVMCDQNDAVALTFGTSGLFKADLFQVVVGTGSVDLKSTVKNTQWHLAAGMGSVFDGVSVRDSNANDGEPVYTVSYTDNGNNDNWFGGARKWTGATDAAWENAENWLGGVPGADSDVFVQGGANAPTISSATSVRSLTVGAGLSSSALTVRAPLVIGKDLLLSVGGTLTADAPIVVSNDVQLSDGSTLTHTAGGAYRIDIAAAGDFTIDSGAKVDVYRRGYGVGKGPGGGSGSTQQGCHASLGYNAASGAIVYGSVRAPIECGSGGGKAAENKGAGGGAIHLDVAGTLTMNGSVSANSGADDWGAGAGGSVWLKAGTIRGAGSVSACCEEKGSGREGGGGRISLVQTVATDWTAFTGAVSAGPSSTSGPGTIYRETAADRPDEGALTVGGVSGYSLVLQLTTNVVDACEPFGKVTVSKYGYFEVASDVALGVTEALTMLGSSWKCPGTLDLCPHPGEQLAVTGTFTCSELVCTSALGTVAFAPGARVTVGTGGRQVKLRGDIGRRLTLKSATEGEAWYVSVADDVPTDLRYLTVSDSDASGGKTMVAKSSGDRKGRNVNWELTAPGTVIVVK